MSESTSDLVNDLVAEADTADDCCGPGTPIAKIMREAAARIRALEAEVENYRANKVLVTRFADRRVAEERRAILALLTRARNFALPDGDIPYKTGFSAGAVAAIDAIESTIRSRSNATGEDKSTSPVGFSDEEEAERDALKEDVSLLEGSINRRVLKADADRRVEEEREAIAKWHDEQAAMYAERAQSAADIGDYDLNSLMADRSQWHSMSAIDIRSRSNDSQHAPSPVGGEDDRAIVNLIVSVGMLRRDVANDIARAVLTHLRQGNEDGASVESIGATFSLAERITELETVCAELYQVIGALADGDVFSHPDVQRALDNASQARLVHTDLLPFPKTPLRTPEQQEGSIAPQALSEGGE